MASSRLNKPLMRATSRRVIEDNVVFVTVYREISGTPTIVCRVHSHIAPTDRQLSGRDLQYVMGDSSPQYNVMHVGDYDDIELDDTAWTDVRRYRVIAVDSDLAGGKQILMRQLQ